MLGGVVGGGSGKDADGGDREIVHDRCTTLHDRKGSLSDEECAIDVRGEDILPDGIRKVVYREIRVSDASVVDDDFKAAEFLPDSAEEAVDGVGIANVAGVKEYVWGLHFFARPLEFGFAASCEDEVGAFITERLGDGQANAARGAGNESSLALEALR